jgi:transposase
MDNGSRYVGLDVHRDTISVAVLDSRGKLMLERVIPTSAAAVLGLLELLRGKLHVAFEEGTSAQWLAGLLQPRVAQVLVCDPRKNDRRGSKNDRIDARELADLLRCGRLSSVFHQDCGLTSLQELARTYLVLTKDQTRVIPYQSDLSQLGDPLRRPELLQPQATRSLSVPVAPCRNPRPRPNLLPANG